ncbi:hypothetical protein IFM89_013630 [Coptis chinensis]|uniref:J domain-containing protein n=1 Tax=Coptis chinensis TaxID=261450 RepID=A0A835MB74_9MAGN|nr:hypothetical protein IFM89_013630 [Coptis chinensis]
MSSLFLSNATTCVTPFSKTGFSYNSSSFPSNCPLPRLLNRTYNPICVPSPSSTSFRVNCRKSNQEDGMLSVSQAYDVLGVTRNCSFIELKTAFRSIVKQFHPDVQKDSGDTDIMIRQVFKAYGVILPASLILLEIFCKSPCPYNSCQLFKYCNCFGNLFS